jgi:hypothetical protein
MNRTLALLVLALGCHDGARDVAPKGESATLRSPTHETANPHYLPQPPASEAEGEGNDDTPVAMGSERGAGAASGVGPAWVEEKPECEGPVYLRVRNASQLPFDSVTIDGIDFGPVRVGAQSQYRQASGCVYWYGNMKVTSGKQSFMVFPIDFVGETPLKPGYFTHALTPVPSQDPRFPGGLEQKISKDPTPQ